ncbi:unnamed protein product, partial [Meganyctiphanes norvegica]
MITFTCQVTSTEHHLHLPGNIYRGNIHRDFAPVLEYKFIIQTLQPGPSVSLKCITSGEPTPQITWTLDGFPLKQDGRVMVGQYSGVSGAIVSHVNLTSVRVEDGGTYTCAAENRAGQIRHSARLNVYGPPYVRPIGIVTAVAGESLMLACPAAGHPLESITWAKEGSQLPASVREHVLDNGTLMVNHLQKTVDDGSYTCTARDSQGRSHSATGTVQVLAPPRLSRFNFREDLRLGERVVAQCTVSSGDTPIHITWKKDGIPLDKVNGVHIRTVDQFTVLMMIGHLTSDHAGNYSCTANNDAASVSESAELHVHVPPSWLSVPQDASVTLGEGAVIPCEAKGFPDPTITWKRISGDVDHAMVLPRLGSGVAGVGARGVATNGSLVFHRVHTEDDGQYLCEASNGVATPLSQLITVTINAPPRFDQSLQKSVSVRRGAQAIMLCHAQGDSPITLIWQAAHTRTTDHSVVRELPGDGVRGELTLPSVMPEDGGSFTCTASNAYGSDTFTVLLSVEDVPGTPYGLHVDDRGSRYLSLSWLPPSTGSGYVQEYIVQYKKQLGSWSQSKEVTVSGSTTTARITSLVPNTHYVVQAKAINNLGASLPSEPLMVMTMGEAPSSPPLGVRADAISPTSISITWTAPSQDTIHGDLLGYHVGVARHDSKGGEGYNYSVAGPGLGGSGRYLVEGLLPWVQYQVVLRAYNTHGDGPLSPPTLVRTQEDVPSKPPVGVECNGGVGGHSLVVRWSPPPTNAHNGNLKAYRLTLTRLDDTTDKVDELVKLITGQEEIVGNLQPWSNYTVNLAGVTGAGAGVTSPDLTCTTDEDVAGIPGGIRVVQAGPSSSLITWLPPRPATGVLQGFTLHHRQPRKHSQQQTSLHAHASSHTLTHLARGTHEFWITARTRVGEGPPTQHVKLLIGDQATPAIASLGQVIVSVSGQDVRLPCTTVGQPTPKPTWTTAPHGQLHSRKFQQDEDGSLLLISVSRDDDRNYTCSLPPSLRTSVDIPTHATYSLHVQASPEPPSVHISGSSSSTLSLAWLPGDNGGAAIRMWAVWWRTAIGGGSWYTHHLGRNIKKHTISGLACGQEYQVYVTARNHVGVSPASRLLTVRTSGSAPVAPSAGQVASGNATGIWVWLSRWRDGGCPITHYTLQLQRPTDTTWTTLASSLAPQEVYEVGGLRPRESYGLRLTAYNAAGHTTVQVLTSTDPLLGHTSQPLESLKGVRQFLPLHQDPRLMASAAASTLALTLTVAATLIYIRRRGFVCKSPASRRGSEDDAKSKTNLLNQREAHYAIVRKPQPLPARGDRIPGRSRIKFSEDIYPYATFKMGEGGRIPSKEDAQSAKFQTYISQDTIYGVTDARPSSEVRYSNLGYLIIAQSESETEHGNSSHTESSNQLDCTTLESHAKLNPHKLQTAKGTVTAAEAKHQQPTSRRSSSQTVHHNLIYAAESTTTSDYSPIRERKSFPRKSDKKSRQGLNPTQGQILHHSRTSSNCESNFSIAASPSKSTDDQVSSYGESIYGFPRKIKPPSGFSTNNELSEAECDLAISGQHIRRIGYPGSQFQAYVAQPKKNKDFSIKV